jgi:ABC-type branched-subunit amino acid transport system substrate-binding protein
MRTKKRHFAWLMALAMVLAACGGTGGETTTTTAAPGQTTTTAPPDGGTTTTAPTEEPGEILTDVGVTDDTISIGLLADLTGIFSPLVQDIVAAQEVYFDQVNAAGGIAGRQVELVIEDTNYNVDQHRQKYEAIRDRVVALSQSTGSPHTAGIIELAQEDNMVLIPLTWYSGWADPAFDGGVALEQQTNYCLEAMNAVEWVSERFEEENGRPPSWAVVSFPGEYGQDGAFGAKHAIQELGLELAYDGEGLITPTPDDPETEVIQGIAGSGADAVFATVNPTNLAVVLGGAAQAGFQGWWTGSVPSYDFRLLDTPVGPLLSQVYWQTAYNVAWGTDVPGMAPLRDAMLAAAPDRRPSDAFVIGWLEAKTIHEVLNIAAANGDMTRAGVKAAALSLEGLNFDGLAPDQSYSPPDDPNTYVTREIAMFKPNLEAYTAAGGANQTIGSAPNGGTTGSDLVEDFFVGDVAGNYVFTEGCFKG